MSKSSGEILFVLSKKDNSSNGEVQVSTTPSVTDSNPAQEPTENQEPEVVLSMLWNAGTLGASYYDIATRQLFVLADVADPNPEFANARSLLRNVAFKHVVSMGNPCDNFVKLIIDWINNKGDETVDSDKIRQVPGNLSLLPASEFSYMICETKIFSLNLPGIPKNTTDSKNDAYFHTLLDFNNKQSVHSLGALIKFVEMSWAYLNIDDNVPDTKFIHINQISMESQVYIDNNTLKTLQIFQKKGHDAKFKHGAEDGNKEGSSIFRLFAQYCKTKLGVEQMRRILLTPTKEINELNKRLNFIEFASQGNNSGFMECVAKNIKKIQDIDRILCRIQYSRGSNYDWEVLYKAVYYTLYINEISAPYKQTVQIFSDLFAAISPDLYTIEHCIRDSLDFSNKTWNSRPLIKKGVDEELDKKKMLRQDIGKYLQAAADFSVKELPDYVEDCTVVYLPEMGHLLGLKKTESNSDPEQLEYLGLEFMFEVNDTFHYKNAMCKGINYRKSIKRIALMRIRILCAELDKHLGQLQNEIIEHEIRIIQRLSGLILRSMKIIKEPLRIIVLMDCLIAMAKVAKENDFVRPTLDDGDVIEIVDGRHILFEMQCDNFVPNGYASGGANGKMKIITGPNSCGKSLFLKQTALLVYLAHVGSFVPAESARICVIRGVHTTMRANESASLPLSGFMIDLTQMARSFRDVGANSLILVDEFGKSTTGQDGLALLAAALNHFLQGEKCPHVVVATHYHQIVNLLPASPLVSHLTFDFTRNDDQIVFLFKLVEGSSESFACDVALAAKMDRKVVDRAKEIYKAMLTGGSWVKEHESLKERDVGYYLNIAIPPLDEP